MDNKNLLCLVNSWSGIPYRYQGRDIETGYDCLGLVESLIWQVFGKRISFPNCYRHENWEQAADESMRLIERSFISCSSLEAGDLLVFRFRQRGRPHHLGLVVDIGTNIRFVHAQEKTGVFVDKLDERWSKFLYGQYRLKV